MKEKALFETVKQGVSNREAAVLYGVDVSQTSMALCPFHPDKHPSLYVADDHFHCFGCGEHGDVIDFTAKLFGISGKSAARKLARDFGVNPNPPPAAILPLPKMPELEQRDLERKSKQSYQSWMFARLVAFSNGDLQALYDRSDGFYRRQLVLATKEKPIDRVDDPDLAEKMKGEVEGIFLWAFEGLQRLVGNNFKFTESQRTRDNRETVKRDNNNIFDFLESEGYIRLKADCSVSSRELYGIYQMWCEENSLIPLKRRSFSDAVIANQKKYNLEYCNNVTNSAGRRVWGFMGIEITAKTNISGFFGDSPCTYVPEEWQK